MPSQAAGVKIGASARMNPSAFSQSRHAWTSVCRILRIAACRGERIQRWRLSKRNDGPCSLGVIGKSTLAPTTSRSRSPSSTPLGERLSSRTTPVTRIEDSCVVAAQRAKTSSGSSAFTATHWTVPLPSRTSRNSSFPLERRL